MNKIIASAAFAAALFSTSSFAVPITFEKLTGVTGGTNANTAVFRADLSTIADPILSITIRDNSAGLGGSPGQFSGFDLDAIKASTTLCADAACAAAAPALAFFDFINGVVFAPGTQRAPADPKLFGTGLAGNSVDNLVATLGLFDGESTTLIPGADGFVSLGDNGVISFNLTSALNGSGVYLYIGEVGDNGEVAASSIEVSDRPVVIPEPSTLGLFGLALLGAAARRKTPPAK